MFFGCKYLKSISGLYNIDTSNLKDISYLFHGCEKLELVPGLSKWNTSKIITMKSMFFQCISLKIIKGLEKWDTSSVTDMSLMFYNCSSLTTLSEISDWNVSKVINMDCIFYGCKKLAHLPKWKTLPCISREKMFMKFIPFESDNDEELINDLNTLEIKEKEKTDFIPKEKDNKINISEDEEEENNEYSYLKNPFHKLDEYKIIRNEILKFLPQIEIVFSVNVKINNKMIDELKNELKDILENNDFSIIEINKGSLKIIVTLQYIYKELIKKMKNNPANKNVKNWQKITDKEECFRKINSSKISFYRWKIT